MRLIVQGRSPLKGVYTPSGNSNEAIALIAASLLTSEKVILHGVPTTTAVQVMLRMAEQLGSSVQWAASTLQLQTPRITERLLNPIASDRPVASTLLLAPILAHREHATLEWTEPLGRLHTHLTALRDLGIKIDIQGQVINLTAKRWTSQKIVLTETSVTATALICLLAAVLGEETTVYNAASEPHIRSLQHLLVKMGVQIEGIGSNLICIRGKADGLGGAIHTVQVGHIEIASIAALAALLPGRVTIDPVIPEDMLIIHKVFERLGIKLDFEDHKLHVPGGQPLEISRREEDVDVAIDTAPWPGFPSDLVAITTVAATQANGTTLIHEKLFNNRLLFVDKLKAMGAQIVLCDPHRAVVVGPTPLRAEYLDNPDVRVGLGLLGAALCAEGQVIIDRAELIERSFENVIGKLQALGADIKVEAT